MSYLNDTAQEILQDFNYVETTCYQETIIKNEIKSLKNQISQKLFEYNHELKEKEFFRAYKEAKKKFCAFRTRFSFKDKLIQIIDQTDSSFENFLLIDIDKEHNDVDKLTINDFLIKDRLKIFEPLNGNLIRITLLKENSKHFYCILSYHTAIMDFNSAKIVMNFINETYIELVNQDKKINKNDSTNFNSVYNNLKIRKEINNDYWKKKLNEIDEKIDLNILKPKNEDIKNEFKSKSLILTEKIFAKLKEFNSRFSLESNFIFQFIFHKIIYIYMNTYKTLIGTTTYSRNSLVSNISETVGCFLNTVPVLVSHENNEITIIDKIKEIQTTLNEYDFHSNFETNSEIENLFGTLFVFESYPNEPVNNLGFKFLESFENYERNNNLIVKENETLKNITIELYYNTAYNNELISNDILLLFEHLLGQIIENPNQKVSDLNYLIPSQELKVLKEWNDTDMDYPEDKLINELFEQTVEKYPNNIAVIYEDIELTYKELNEKANQLSNYLSKNFDIKPDDIIALCLDKSELMIITIIAVWKSGAAYVPMDPNYPDQRIEYILKDTQSKIVITNEIYSSRIDKLDKIESITILIDDSKFQELLSDYSKLNIKNNSKSNNISHVIYTSGTTGNPKGVLIEHKSVNLKKTNDIFKNNSEWANVIQLANYVHVVSVNDILATLFHGHKLVIPVKNILKNLDGLNVLFKNQKVSAMIGVVSLINMLDFTGNRTIKNVFIGGEKLKQKDCAMLKNKLPNDCNISSVYGMSETSLLALNKTISPENLSLGKPLNNLKCYVLNMDLKAVPIGAIGELHMGGAGVARGYLNKPELTKEKFISNPFQTEEEKIKGKNSRIYKTGDLVKWLPDGNIEYIGRNDFQVKIRGFRIELEEIESVLLKYEGIKQSVVLVKERKKDNDETIKYLVGYYVADNKLDEDLIMNHLKQKLVEYMVPSILIHLDKFPITANGKLDTKALPDRDIDIENNYVEPRNELEFKIQQIFSIVLGIEQNKISIKDDFFMLGGDSIVSIQLVSKIREALGYTLSIKDIFQYKTIELLYDNIIINNKSNMKEIKSEQGILEGEFDLLPIQKWFLNSNYQNKNYFNQSFMIKIPKLNINKLKLSIKKLIEQHDSLRLKFKKDLDNKYYQYYDNNNNTDIHLQEIDIKSIKNKDLNNLLTEFQCNFNIENGPLYNYAYLYGYDDDSCRLWFAFHHLIIDTVSWRIILDDLKRIYNDEKLSNKGTSYRQWIETINNYDSNEKEYWSNIINDYENNKINDLLFDKNINNYETFELNEEQTDILLRQCNKTFNTNINDILLTALSYTLSELTNNNKNYILLEGHGREDIDDTIDISKTIGWFTSMYPVCLYKKDDLSECIIENKENLRLIPNKGVLFGKYNGYNINDNLPKISFNYLGQFDNIQKYSDYWSITNELSGNSEFINGFSNITINFLEIDNILQFRIQTNFLNSIFFSKNFNSNLSKLISHLNKFKRTFLTSSDINYIVDQNSLKIIQANLEIDSIFNLNNLQEGFIYNYIKSNKINDIYFYQVLYEFNTSIDSINFFEAWKLAKKRFSALRSRYFWKDNLIQIIDKYDENIEFFKYFELDNNLNENEVYLKIQEIKAKDRLNFFKLDEGNLFRVILIKINGNKYVSLLSFHHTILDGWSIPILTNFVYENYLNLLDKQEINIIKKDNDFINVQKYLKINTKYEYWNKKLNEIEENIDLKLFTSIHNQIEKSITSSKKEIFKITTDKYNKLKKLNLLYSITKNALFQFIWHKIFSVYSNTKQTIIGTTMSGRNIPVNNIENVVGCLINTLPLIVNHHNDDIFVIDKIKEIQDSIHELNNNSNVKLSKLQSNRNNLFDILFVFENYPEIKNDKINKLNIKQLDSEDKESDYDVPINIISYENKSFEEIRIEVIFSNKLDENLIKDTIELFEHLLGQIIENPNQKVSDLNYLIPSQELKVLKEWNDTDMDYPEDKLINELFEQTVEKYPNNIAVIYEDIELTYKELNEKANQLSNYLSKNFDIKPDDIIALCLDKSELMIITIIAVWKSGAAYVPMDPNYPDQRIEYILKDTQSKIVITNEIYLEKIKKLDLNLKSISIDNNNFQRNLNNFSINNTANHSDCNNLVYVIYTSGTTGLPKGVLIMHKNFNAFNSLFDLKFKKEKKFKTVLQHANYIFDASVFDLCNSIFRGNRLVIAPKNVFSSGFIEEFFRKFEINLMFVTPSMFDSLKLEKIETLENIILGGEKINKSSFQTFENTKLQMINMYGPTEIVCAATINECVQNTNLSIGKPLKNYKCYIINSNLKHMPIGAVGELHIGGAGVARGYLNKPELTKEKFISNPFQTEEEKIKGKNSRIYKTGDLVKWLPDGNIEYIGRNDFQVKIRGFRIELEEIESVLLKYEGIKQSVVLVKERKKDNDETIKYLVGYYVADNKLDEDLIMNHLKQKLVEYMVPSILIHLDKFPITANGKLDTKALPDRDIDIENNYVEPRNELEFKIQQIFSIVLGIEQNKISIKDDFFMLGGDSIVSIQLVSKIREALGYTLSIKDIFQYKTIELLYDNIIINNKSNMKEIKSEQGILEGEFDLLPIQKWFLNSNYQNKNYFNQSFMIKIPKLNINKLKLSIKKLIEQHDSLRLKFKKDLDNKYYQYYDNNNNTDIHLQEIDIKSIKNKDLNNLLTEFQCNFNIENGPLYNYAYLYGYDDDSCRLWFAFHHLIIDTVSWRIILDDLKRIYNDEKLSNKGTSYRQWIETINNYDSNEKEYWSNIINDYENNKINDLLFDKNINNYETFELNEEQTDILLRQCNKTFNTNINDILLTALSYTLSELTNNNKNYILLEGHGREDIDDTIDISKTIGWFTSMYPVCLYKKDDLSECIIENKENLRLIPNKGVLFGKYNGYNINDNLPKISFNYLGQFDNIQKYSDYWSITNELSGNNGLNNLETNISINSNCINKIFQCLIQSNIKDNKISKLFAIDFKRNIIKLIEYCISLKRTYLTSSDINYIVDQKTLLDLQTEQESDNFLPLFEKIFNDILAKNFYFEPYLLVNDHIKDQNYSIFIFPPGNGGSESYLNNIVTYLKERKLILFNNILIHIFNLNLFNIANKLTRNMIACFYINFLKRIQPSGPYNFIGWSFGGTLALEISRILKEKYHDIVLNLFLIDSPINIIHRYSIRSSIDNFYDFENTTFEIDPKIFLFKPLKLINEQYRYFFDTKANYLDKIIPLKKLNVISMEGDHDFWIKNKGDILKISENILKITS
jgi:amino acid adenylation domain-containing protein/non-ribosomal peptide synthase protein (TIGR01720 family)